MKSVGDTMVQDRATKLLVGVGNQRNMNHPHKAPALTATDDIGKYSRGFLVYLVVITDGSSSYQVNLGGAKR